MGRRGRPFRRAARTRGEGLEPLRVGGCGINTFGHLVLLAFIPATIALFALLPARRAVLIAAFGGWMFLPEKTAFVAVGLPDVNKHAAIGAAILLATAIFQTERLIKFRPTRWDLPILVWCLVPIASSVSNDVGGSLFSSLYGGVSLLLSQLRTYGLAYLVGRLYFRNFEDLKALAVGFFVAGLVYVPFCLVEMRMTPQFHNWIYGFHAHSFGQTRRLGAYRPTVFMQHGLMLGMFLTAALVCGVWLRLSKTRIRLAGVDLWWWVAVLAFTAVMSRSSGALGLLIIGVGLALAIHFLNWRWCFVVVLMIPLLYMTTRGVGVWEGEGAVKLAGNVLNEERAGSLEGRMRNEDLFVEKARERPIIGWSGWGRFLVRDDRGRSLTTPDGLWVIALGQYGLVGLTSITLVLLLPAGVMLRRYPAKLWNTKAFGPVVALTTLLVLYMIDCLFNAMIGPPYLLTAGALASVLPYGQVAYARKTRRNQRPAQRPVAASPRTAEAAC